MSQGNIQVRSVIYELDIKISSVFYNVPILCADKFYNLFDYMTFETVILLNFF